MSNIPWYVEVNANEWDTIPYQSSHMIEQAFRSGKERVRMNGFMLVFSEPVLRVDDDGTTYVLKRGIHEPKNVRHDEFRYNYEFNNDLEPELQNQYKQLMKSNYKATHGYKTQVFGIYNSIKKQEDQLMKQKKKAKHNAELVAQKWNMDQQELIHKNRQLLWKNQLIKQHKKAVCRVYMYINIH